MTDAPNPAPDRSPSEAYLRRRLVVGTEDAAARGVAPSRRPIEGYAMTDPSPPEGDALAAAEEWARWAAVHDDWDKTRVLMGVLLAEYDRRGRQFAATSELAAAARAVVAEYERHGCVVAMSMDTETSTGLLDALAARVKELES